VKYNEGEYGLRWNPNPPLTVTRLVVYALAIGVYTILTWVSVVSAPTQIPGIGTFFIAIGFGVPFALWFGGWGLVMGFIGTSIGAGLLGGLSLPVSLAFGVSDIILFGSLIVLYRSLAVRFRLNPIGKDVFTRRGFAFFFICGATIPHLLGAVYGAGLLYAVGFIPAGEVLVSFGGLWIGNMVVCTLISPILMSALGPVVERHGLTSHGLLT